MRIFHKPSQKLKHPQCIQYMDENASEPLDCSSSNLSLSPGRPDADHNSMMVDSSSGSSEESVSPSPSNESSSRRPSLSDDVYWERRKRNNDSAKRSREKRRLNDMAMEQRLLELSKENSRLKSALEAQYGPTKATTHDSVIVPNPKLQEYSASNIHPTPLYPIDMTAKLPPSLFPTPLLAGPQLLTAAPGHTISPFMQMCQLHALQNPQYRSTAGASPADILASTCGRGAFQPFNPSSKIVSTGASSPDSSTSQSSDLISQSLHLHDPLFDGKQYLRNRFLEHAEPRCLPESLPLSWENIYPTRTVEQSAAPELPNQPQAAAQDNVSSTNERPQSLLGTLLSTTRRSPSVPQSRTEQQSGLSCETSNDLSTGKSDSDSLGSPVSSQGSTTDSHQSSPGSSKSSNNSAIVQALNTRPDQERYMDRRRRNNEAAKRCRANRRAVFEYRSKRAQQLEAENGELRKEMLKLSHELEHLKALMAAKNVLVNPAS
uniref:BZIP domain-containing protein n=1 Tax=Steinernema glaseri TaxID=37863 RepID=A0A1I8AUT6_9BILA